jgi:hypothetical protein
MNESEDKESLAREILEQVVEKYFKSGEYDGVYHDLLDTAEGVPVFVYGAQSVYGTFRCEYRPLRAVIKILHDCERLFDELKIEEAPGKSVCFGDFYQGSDFREYVIEATARSATAILLTGMQSRLCEIIQAHYDDSLIAADSIFMTFIASNLKKIAIDSESCGPDYIADFRPTIEEAAERAASQERELLIKLLKSSEHAIVMKSRGGSEPEVVATDSQCKKMAEEYPALHKHWKDVRQLRTSSKDWRAYAKAIYADTTDDLLERLNSLDPYENKPSAVAHEHAARRAGIETKGCSQSTLGRLRRRGESLL